MYILSLYNSHVFIHYISNAKYAGYRTYKTVRAYAIFYKNNFEIYRCAMVTTD